MYVNEDIDNDVDVQLFIQIVNKLYTYLVV